MHESPLPVRERSGMDQSEGGRNWRASSMPGRTRQPILADCPAKLFGIGNQIPRRGGENQRLRRYGFQKRGKTVAQADFLESIA